MFFRNFGNFFIHTYYIYGRLKRDKFERVRFIENYVRKIENNYYNFGHDVV